MKNYMILTFILFLGSNSLNAQDRQGDFAEDDNDTTNEVFNLNATEEANRLINIARAAERWFENNSIEPRVHEYDVAYELPMNEIKASGELPMSYALPPGGASGTDEDSLLGTGYTLRVIKTRVAGADKFRITATIGDKVQPLPLTPAANCYIYGSRRLDGVIQDWNWHLIPSTSSLPLPYANTTCAAMSAQLPSVEVALNSAWTLLGASTSVRPDDINCQVVASIPGFATPPSGHYEDVIHCNFDYITPPTSTYCNGSLLITRHAGGTDTINLGQRPDDCGPAESIYFRGSSNTYISNAGLDTSSPTCSILNQHFIRCSATENPPSGGGGGPGGGADAECDVYVYNSNGILPSTPDFHWDGTDCTGMNTAVQTIMEYVEYDEYLNGVFALDSIGNVDPERINANKYCDMHFDNSGTLGAMFANELHYNCDEQPKLDEFVFNYNFANPTSQLTSCQEYTGALGPGDVKHKANCERDSTNYTTNLIGRTVTSDFDCELTGNNCRLGDGVNEININQISTTTRPAVVESWRGWEGFTGGGGDWIYHDWLTVSDGTLNDLVTAGYTYSLSLTFSGSDSDLATVNCSSSHSGAAINLNTTTVQLSAHIVELTNDESAFARCSWTGTIYEYKNGAATGGRADFVYIIEGEQN